MLQESQFRSNAAIEVMYPNDQIYFLLFLPFEILGDTIVSKECFIRFDLLNCRIIITLYRERIDLLI